MNFRIFLVLLFIFYTLSGIAQGRFHIMDQKESVSLPFTLINNLIVIQIEVNGTELSFLFDTGIDKTILFNLKVDMSERMKDVEEIELKGLGEGEALKAMISRNNLFVMDGLINPNQMTYIIYDNMFDLSGKMGIDINGIIGGDLFRDFVVKVNYSSKKLIFYNPKTYTYKKCSNCETFPLDFYSEKPFIDVVVQNHLGEEFDVKLLIDSGGGDALWLFENSHPKIIVSDKYFNDYLGKGLNGDIYGKRSKINKLKIGSFIFENASVSYPDSLYIVAAYKNKERNGTLGANVLRRFHVIYDYPGRKITLKKNSHYKKPFLYNKSGLELSYGGDMVVKETKSKFTDGVSSDGESITQIISSYVLAYKPSYVISQLRDDSPAKNAGLMIGDIILEINGSVAYNKEMQDIIHILSQKENKKIKLLISRNGQHLKYEFYLKSMFE